MAMNECCNNVIVRPSPTPVVKVYNYPPYTTQVYMSLDYFKGQFTDDHDAAWLILNPPGTINNPWAPIGGTPIQVSYPYSYPLTYGT